MTYITESSISYTEKSDDDIVITVKRSHNDETCFDHFRSVTIDGNEIVKGEDYTAVPGSTVITLNGPLLRKLSVGGHNITVVFDDGQAEIALNVKSAAPISPQTGDNDYVMILFVMIAAGSVLFIIRKKNQALD